MKLYLTPASVPELAGLPVAEQKAHYKTLARRGLAHLGGVSGLIKKHPWVPFALGGLLLVYFIVILSSIPQLLKSLGFLVAFFLVVFPVRSILWEAGREALRQEFAQNQRGM